MEPQQPQTKKPSEKTTQAPNKKLKMEGCFPLLSKAALKKIPPPRKLTASSPLKNDGTGRRSGFLWSPGFVFFARPVESRTGEISEFSTDRISNISGLELGAAKED